MKREGRELKDRLIAEAEKLGLSKGDKTDNQGPLKGDMMDKLSPLKGDRMDKEAPGIKDHIEKVDPDQKREIMDKLDPKGGLEKDKFRADKMDPKDALGKDKFDADKMKDGFDKHGDKDKFDLKELEKEIGDYDDRPEREELSTGDVIKRDDEGETLNTPNGDQIALNDDGSHSIKGDVRSVDEKDGVTTVKFGDGSSVSFDKEGFRSVQRGNQGVAFSRRYNGGGGSGGNDGNHGGGGIKPHGAAIGQGTINPPWHIGSHGTMGPVKRR